MRYFPGNIPTCLGGGKEPYVDCELGKHILHMVFLMNREVQPYCEDCLVPLTVRHLLVECPSYGDLRNRFLSGGRGPGVRCTLSSILGEEVVFDTSGIFKFISEAGLLNKI